jgi:hypothetical protein
MRGEKAIYKNEMLFSPPVCAEEAPFSPRWPGGLRGAREERVRVVGRHASEPLRESDTISEAGGGGGVGGKEANRISGPPGGGWWGETKKDDAKTYVREMWM